MSLRLPFKSGSTPAAYVAVRQEGKRRFYDFNTWGSTPAAVATLMQEYEKAGLVDEGTTLVGIQKVKLVNEGPTLEVKYTPKPKAAPPTLLVYARPKKPQAWWPRERGKPVWVGLLGGGCGWVVGEGDKLNVDEALEAIESIEREITRPGFRVLGPTADRKRLLAALEG
jgi:hypothetical protein